LLVTIGGFAKGFAFANLWLEEVRFRAFRRKSPYRWRKAEGFSPTP
jgi:hypothetical protein